MAKVHIYTNDEKMLPAPPEEKLISEHAHGESDGHQDLAAVLYKQNVELSVRNKTLSLLRKLYQMSILTLEPDVIAEKITSAIRQDLNFELVGIMIYDQAKGELAPLKLSESDRFAKARHAIDKGLFGPINIKELPADHVFKIVVEGKMMANAQGLTDVGAGLSHKANLVRIGSEAKVSTSLIYPLIIEDRVIGVLVMCLNREYDDLSKFEKESIESFINVIAVSLDRAFIYQQLRAANEKLKELDKLKSEFLSFASHQVKTPMSVVKGYASLIYDGIYGEVTPGVRDTALKIKSSADKMINLVGDLLDLRKIEEGKMEYYMETVDLNKFVGDMVDELRTLANLKKLELTFVSTVTEVKIMADTQKFRQVIQNYIENAIKYTPAGWVKVEITEDNTQQATDNKKYVLITVSDSGLGMSKELIPQLFQQFSRDKQASVKILGTGLGLFIAKTIVEGHGGKTWAESDGEGKGSRFYVKISKI